MQYCKLLLVLPKSLLSPCVLNISAVVTLKIFITTSNNAWWCHNPLDTWYFHSLSLYSATSEVAISVTLQLLNAGSGGVTFHITSSFYDNSENC